MKKIVIVLTSLTAFIFVGCQAPTPPDLSGKIEPLNSEQYIKEINQ